VTEAETASQARRRIEWRELTAVTAVGFTRWLQVYQNEDEELATFLQNRFPEPLATTFPLWIEERPLLDPDAPATPFEMPTYVIPESVAAAEADDRADATFAEGSRRPTVRHLHDADGGLREAGLSAVPAHPSAPVPDVNHPNDQT
jgi:hypothetical protein